MKPFNYKNLLLLLFLLTAAGFSGQAQPANKMLQQEILKQDSLFFDAFNKRDTNTLKNMMSADLEFFHDKSGLTGRQHTLDFLKSLRASGNDLKRSLLPGTTEIYPIPGYGAIQTGSHRFCHTENNKQDCGTFKFTNIWQQRNGQWQLTRIISYDH